MIASETASRHQPMNWRDSIWVQTSVTQWAFPMRSTQHLIPYSENKGYMSNPSKFAYGAGIEERIYIRFAKTHLCGQVIDR